MTGEELKGALKELNWKQTEFARKLGINKMTVFQWTRSKPPKWAAEYIRAMLALKALHSEFLAIPKAERDDD